MPINPAIAMSFQAPKFEDPMNNMIKMEQIKAYQQNALAKQLEAEVAQESLGQQRGLRNYLAGLEPGASPDMNMLARFGKTGREYGKDIAEAQSKQMEMASKLYKEMYLPILGQAKTRDDVLAWHTAMEQDPRLKGFLTPQGKAMLPKSDADVPDYLETTLIPISERYKRDTTEAASQARLDAAKIRAAATRAAAERTAERPFDLDGNLVSPSGKIIYQKTQTPEKAPTSVEEYNFYADQEKREGRPVKSYEQWVNAKNAPAAKQLTPYQQQKIKDNVAEDYKNLSKVFDDVEGIVAGIEDVRNSPGLEAETGYGSYLYSFPEGEAAKAQTRLDRLKGKITSIGKSVASMSGAIGSMAVAEWKILRDQVGALDTAIKKGKTVTEEELNSIESFAMGFKNRAADAYTKQYGEYFEQFPQYQELPSFDPGKRQEVKRKAATNSNAVDTSNPLLGD